VLHPPRIRIAGAGLPGGSAPARFCYDDGDDCAIAMQQVAAQKKAGTSPAVKVLGEDA
jgi:hypothetical protein